MRGLEDAGAGLSSLLPGSLVLKIASPPLLSYHLSTIAHLHQPASFCVDTFLLCLPLRCGCSSFPALPGLHVDLLCIAALLRHLGEFPFPSGFSLLRFNQMRLHASRPFARPARSEMLQSRLRRIQTPSARSPAPVGIGFATAVMLQCRRNCRVAVQSINPSIHQPALQAVSRQGLDYFATHVAQLMLMHVIHWVSSTDCRADSPVTCSAPSNVPSQTTSHSLGSRAHRSSSLQS